MTEPKSDKQVILLIENVRLSLVYAYRPYIGKNDQGKDTKSYKADALIPSGHPALQKVKDAQKKAAQAAWPTNWEQVLMQLASSDKLCLHNAAMNPSRSDKPEYAGMFYVTGNVKVKPRTVVTRGGVNVDTLEDDACAVYSGCWGNMIVAIYGQSPDGGKPNPYGKRINAQLMGLQFLKHDEKFGGSGRIAKPEEFGIAAPDADGAVPMTAAQPSGPGSDLI